MRAILAICAAALALSACSRLPSLPGSGIFARSEPEAPLPFPAEIETTRGDPNFRVAVAAGNAGLPQVRESVRYPATVYCFRQFGSSEIDWAMAGSDWAFARTPDGALVFQGRCAGRPPRA